MRSEDPYQNLANAIVLSAVKDYRDALKKLKKKPNNKLAADERDDLSFVWEAVKSLPVKYREVIHLFYHEGCSVREISNILKHPEATVRSDLHRGRERLREILREEYDFDEAL